MTGFLMTFSSFSGPFTPRMDNLCSNCTETKRSGHAGTIRQKLDAPMRPLNLLKVLGIRTWGLTSIRTPLAVWIYTWSRPALFRGESSSVSRHYTHRSVSNENNIAESTRA